MSIETESVPADTTALVRRVRPLSRRVLHWVRRLHLFLRLFVLTWALLYGVSGFLFNHPTAVHPPTPREEHPQKEYA